MFFQSERGRFIGIYALALTNGVGTRRPLHYKVHSCSDSGLRSRTLVLLQVALSP
jgi:hypothetical protein